MGQLQTRNVTINFNDVPDGQVRAQAIAQTCENDLTRLNSLFRIPYDVDGLNAAGLRVYIISPASGGASNTGWHGMLVPSQMDINGDYTPATTNLQTATTRDELARFLFIAELAEIYMGIAPGGWHAGWSDGEALSIIVGTELHPMGYYGAAGAPRVNTWLQSDRPDFISNTDFTDKNQLSYGCGILFLNYLRHQLGFDLADIIAVKPTKWPVFTLADRYAALTGKQAAQAYPEFMNFLDRVLPRDRAALAWVGRDDIFPLRDAAHRSAYMSVDTLQIASNRIEPSKHVSIQPGPLCGEKDYRFWRTEETTQITANAACSGFADASFHWSINGVDLGPASSPLLEVVADIAVPMPDRTTQAKTGETVRITYALSASWNRGTLIIRNIDHDATYHLDIRVTARETLVNDGDAVATNTADLSTLHFEYESVFRDDQRRCNGELEQISAELLKMTEHMRVVINAPDPQPELRVAAILEAAKRVNARIAAAAEKMGATGQVFLQELSRTSRISQEVSVARTRLLHAQQEQAAKPVIERGAAKTTGTP